jgi:predicted RNase H-like HicB family nuclease
MKNFNLPIIIEQDKDGYVAFCPELQGCYSQGETYEETIDNIKDAIKLHLQDRIAEKEELPEVKSVSLSTVHITL